MSKRQYNDGLAYTKVFAITPTSNTEIDFQLGLMLDADGTIDVRFEKDATAITLTLKGGIIYPIRVFSVDSIATATVVQGLA
jgi:hypothetical protein